jgi:anti-sigma factor RsiW
MTIDDAQLMAFADGELPPSEHADVEKAVHESADMAARVAMLRASQLPYTAAFGQQSLPPVPERLALRVDEMIRRHLRDADARARIDHDPANDGPSIAVPGRPATEPAPLGDNVHPLPVRARATPRAALPWLAVAFVAGAFCCGLALHFVPQLTGDSTTMMAAANPGMSPWIAAAAGYQQLYTRDTVAQLQPDMQATAATVDAIRHDDDLAVQVPDLRSVGLTFKRIQRLRFHDKPLVQIVYLPEKGGPVALCVLKEASADAAPAGSRVDGMDVVAWRRGQLGYALIGSHGDVDLGALGKQLYDGTVTTTISRNDSRTGGREG